MFGSIFKPMKKEKHLKTIVAIQSRNTILGFLKNIALVFFEPLEK